MNIEQVLRVEHEGIKLVEDINMFRSHHPSTAALFDEKQDEQKKESP
jgi:hypothetical protein